MNEEETKMFNLFLDIESKLSLSFSPTFREVKIGIKNKEDLKSRNKEWLNVLQEASNTAKKDSHKIQNYGFVYNEEVGRAFFKKLAKIGYFLYMRFLEEEDQRNTLKRDLIADDKYPIIQFNSDNFFCLGNVSARRILMNQIIIIQIRFGV